MNASLIVALICFCTLTTTCMASFVQTQNSHLAENFVNEGLKNYDYISDDNAADDDNDDEMMMLKRADNRKRYQDISAIHRMKSGPAIGSWYYIMGHSKGAKRASLLSAAKAPTSDDVTMMANQHHRHERPSLYRRQITSSFSINRPSRIPHPASEKHPGQTWTGSTSHNNSGTGSSIVHHTGRIPQLFPAGLENNENVGSGVVEKLGIRTGNGGEEKLRQDLTSSDNTGIGEILVDLLLQSEH